MQRPWGMGVEVWVSNTETAGQLSPRWTGEDMEQDEVAGKAVPCTQERGTQL